MLYRRRKLPVGDEDPLNRPTNVSWTPAPAAVPATSSVAFTHSYNHVNQRIGQAANDNSWLYYPHRARRRALS